MESEIVKKSLKHKKCKKSKKSKVISFDEEVVPKQLAEKILIKRQNEKEAQVTENGKENDSDVNIINESSVKKNKKNKKQKFIEEQPDNDKKTEDEDSPETNNQNVLIKKKKKPKREKQSVGNNESNEEIEDNFPKKKRKKIEPEHEEEANEEFDAADSSSSAPKKKESIRERKRKRHAKLIEEKKLKTELALQQKSLNYLSKWKHSREEWKFEKLRQIWLQQNIYDSAKIPKEFWDTLVEYFNNCKGKARDIILKEALKIIEEQGEEDVEPDSEHFVKIKRARDIIQNLQE